MKEETRKRKEKMKKDFVDVEKQVKKNGKKLSTAEKNKMMIDIMTKKGTKEVEEIIEKRKKPKNKHFTCSCGCKVTLEGEAETLVVGKCTKCAEESLEKNNFL